MKLNNFLISLFFLTTSVLSASDQHPNDHLEDWQNNLGLFGLEEDFDQDALFALPPESKEQAAAAIDPSAAGPTYAQPTLTHTHYGPPPVQAANQNPSAYAPAAWAADMESEESMNDSYDRDMPVAQQKQPRAETTCAVCGKHFSTKTNLKIHMRIHTQENSYKCIPCNTAFNRKHHLQDHEKSSKHLKKVQSLANTQERQPSSSPMVVGETFFTDLERVEAADKDIAQTIAYENFSLSGDDAMLVDDREELPPTPAPAPPQPFFCHACKTPFTSQASFDGHFPLCIGNSQDQEQQTAVAVTKPKNNQQNAQTSAAAAPAEPFDAIATLTALKEQLAARKKDPQSNVNPAKKAKDVQVSFICEYCGKLLTSLGSLERHEKTHTNNSQHASSSIPKAPQKSHACTLCLQVFSSKKQLYNHYKTTHPDSRPYICTICPATFANHRMLKRHMARHALGKTYTCSLCNKEYSTQTLLLEHRAAAHAGQKLYPCTMCDQAFAQPSDLEKHGRIHTGERPYKCNTCDLDFIRADHLQKHVNSKRHKKRAAQAKFMGDDDDDQDDTEDSEPEE